MRKLVFFLASFTIFSSVASVEYPTGSGIYYDWDEDGVFYVNWVDPAATLGDVVIPDSVEIDGYKYVPMYLGEWTNGFWGNASITSLTINAPIPEISGWKFEKCTNLTSVKFTNGALRTIGEQAFANCPALQVLELPEGFVEIGQSAFWGAPIEQIVIPASVQTIAGYVFGGNSAMTSATFNGVPQSVGENIFTWDEEAGYGNFFVCASYWNARALKEVLDVNNGGLQYKVWDAQLDETWNNPTYLIPCYTDELVVRRTLQGGQWTPIVLPAWLDRNQLAAALGNGVKLAQMTGIEGNELCFDLVELSEEVGMEPNTPYLINVEQDVTEFTIPYIWLNDNYDNLVEVAEGAFFVGSLNGYEMTVPDGAYYLDGGNLAQSDGTAVLHAMDGYFTADSPITAIKVNGDTQSPKGDVNGDGEINIADINAVIDIILGGNDSTEGRSDVNGDSEVNIADINAVIDIILG